MGPDSDPRGSEEGERRGESEAAMGEMGARGGVGGRGRVRRQEAKAHRTWREGGTADGWLELRS